jgi:hypothetical protein
MEEIECFRTLSGSGSGSGSGAFSQDKHYEYVYSTRKSFEYIPALGRSDWRHFTTNAYQYAGKWLRSCSRGFGDGGDYWEVFLRGDVDGDIVSWDYNATLCFRECSGSGSGSGSGT